MANGKGKILLLENIHNVSAKAWARQNFLRL